MEYVLSAAICGLQLFIFTLVFDSFFVRKARDRVYFISFVLFWVLLFWAVNFMNCYISIMKICLVTLLLFAFCRLLYAGRLAVQIVATVTSYIVFFLIGVTVELIVMTIKGLNSETFVDNIPLFIFTMFLENVVSLFCAILIKYSLRRNKFGDSPYWILTALFFPISSTCALLILFRSFPDNDTVIDMWIWLLSFLAIANVVMSALLTRLRKYMDEREKLLASYERMRVQNESMEALGQAYANQRKSAHDFNHHMTVIEDLLQHSEPEKALQYVNTVQKSQTQRVLLVNTHNAFIDSILNSKGYNAQKHNIEVTFKVSNLKNLQISSADLSCVLGNLLDNAIEACERLPEEREKWIEVQMLYTPKSKIVQNAFLFLSVSNSSLPVQIDGDSIPSSKEKPYLHGYGIPNILDVLKKYQAEHVLTYQDGQFVFSIEWPDGMDEL